MSDGAVDKPVRVFISYCHSDGGEDYRERALKLAQCLRRHGIDAVIDQFFETTPPPQGWPNWALDEVEAADFVLVVCTGAYYERFRKREVSGVGNGATWEGGIITQSLYDAALHNTKFIPIGFDDQATIHSFIPDPLRSTSYRDVCGEESDENFLTLLRQLYGEPAVLPEPLGKRLANPKPAVQLLSSRRMLNIARRNPFFVGRDAYFEQLHAALEGDGTAAVAQAVTGLGGIGKTALVTEYAYRYQKEYERIFFVNASSVTT